MNISWRIRCLWSRGSKNCCWNIDLRKSDGTFLKNPGGVGVVVFLFSESYRPLQVLQYGSVAKPSKMRNSSWRDTKYEGAAFGRPLISWARQLEFLIFDGFAILATVSTILSVPAGTPCFPCCCNARKALTPILVAGRTLSNSFDPFGCFWSFCETVPPASIGDSCNPAD